MWCRLVFVLTLVTIFHKIHAQDEGDVTEDTRNAKEFDMNGFRAVDIEKWHAIDYQQSDPDDWIPTQSQTPLPSDDEPVITKRRRPGRKRKRRPQNAERDFTDDDRLPRPRPRRPQRLDTRREQWREEMLAEEPFRPIRNYSRRRQYPKYEETSQEEKDLLDDEPRTTETIIEKVRDPYTALNQDQSRRRPYSKRKYTTDDSEQVSQKDDTYVTDRADVANPTDLKTLLKQSGGISLSELLQQKNLSLADLLKGEQHAISALTNIPEHTSESSDNKFTYDMRDKDRKHNSGQRRLPPVRKYIKNNDYFSRENLERTTEYNKYITKQTETETESVSERRIFVPSHPKYYTSVDYKPNMKDLTLDKSTVSIGTTTTAMPEQTSESISIISSTVTFSTSENPSTKNKIQIKTHSRFTLPPTYAKLKNMALKTTTKSITNNNTNYNQKTPTVPAKAVKININELFGVSKLFNNNIISTSTSTTEGPMKISVDLEQIIQKSNKNKSRTDEISAEEQEKLKELTAKDEIMEILSDNVSRQNLKRLLELRNMTVDELVEQRERGSSQRHLADIFHNKTKEPEPLEEEIIVDEIAKNESPFTSSIFDTFPKFNHPDNKIPYKSIKQPHYYISGVELQSKTRESRENQFSNKESEENNFISNPIFKTTTGKTIEHIGKIIPVWKQAYTNQKKLIYTDKFLDDELIIKDEAQRIEEIENKLAEAVNGALNIDVLNHKTYDDEENEFFRLPYGVRSAIIASAVIIGMSLIVFLTIFIIFKWMQRQRSHLNYSNSFSSSKIKAPILETPYQRRIFSSIMNSTLGRKKKISTISCTEPHSLQEYLWDTDRKPFQ